MNSAKEAQPYWVWLGRQGDAEGGRAGLDPCGDAAGPLGERFTAIVDRLRGLDVPVQEVTDEFRIFAAELEKCGFRLDAEVKEIVRKRPLSAEEVRRLAHIAELKQAAESIVRYAEWLEACPEDRYARLRALSRRLFTDMKRAFRLLEQLGEDTGQIELCLAYLRQAVHDLLSAFKGYLLKNYTDYFTDFLPITPFHLGHMLQCAAILEHVVRDELSGQEPDREEVRPVFFPARAARDLLDWLGEGAG